MSQIIAKSSHWPGFEGIRRLFIFGDSYSSVFWSHTGFSPSSHPTAQHPLGTPFPGSTFNEEDLPNWVGHLITKYCPAPRYDPSTDDQEDGFADDPLLVYNYARGGDQVSGVARQIRRLFLPIVGTKPEWAPWSENDSLFVTSVGINDCAVSREGDFPLRISLLMELQEELYANGARNFLFFDVPPIDMAPAIAEKRIQYGILSLTSCSFTPLVRFDGDGPSSLLNSAVYEPMGTRLSADGCDGTDVGHISSSFGFTNSPSFFVI